MDLLPNELLPSLTLRAVLNMKTRVKWLKECHYLYCEVYQI